MEPAIRNVFAGGRRIIRRETHRKIPQPDYVIHASGHFPNKLYEKINSVPASYAALMLIALETWKFYKL